MKSSHRLCQIVSMRHSALTVSDVQFLLSEIRRKETGLLVLQEYLDEDLELYITDDYRNAIMKAKKALEDVEA